MALTFLTQSTPVTEPYWRLNATITGPNGLNLPSAAPFTLSSWVKIIDLSNSYSSGVEKHWIIGHDDSFSTSTQIAVAICVMKNVGSSVSFGVLADPNNLASDVEANITGCGLGSWHHICLAVDSATSRRFYLDGILRSTVTTSKTFANLSSPFIGTWTLGNGYIINNYSYTSGIDIDDFCIFNRGLSTNEVFQLSKGADPLSLRATVWQTFSGRNFGLDPTGAELPLIDVPTSVQNSHPNSMQYTYDLPTPTGAKSIMTTLLSRRRLFVVS